MQIARHVSRTLVDLIHLDRRAFAAKIRMARAVLNWSQSELAARVGLSQRAIHKLEHGDSDPRRSTVRGLEQVWRAEGIEFEDLPGGGFRISVHPPILHRAAGMPVRRQRNTQ